MASPASPSNQYAFSNNVVLNISLVTELAGFPGYLDSFLFLGHQPTRTDQHQRVRVKDAADG
jgi:hypothetical protein